MAHDSNTGERWHERPVATRLLRAAIYAVPAGVSVATGLVVSRHLPKPAGVAGDVVWVLGVLACSMIALVLVERVARRFLPLVTLLRLSLVFPDRAPSRFAIALRAGNPRRLNTWAEQVRNGDIVPDAGTEAETVLRLVMALKAHDHRTRGHSDRVQALSELVAKEMRLPDEAVARLRWGALLHDIGKLTVPSDVLNDPGRPDPAGLAALRQHPDEGLALAEPLASWLGEWRHAIDQHHERFDGTGYPRGLAGNDISLAGRIVAVTDAYETMTAVRSYKKAMSIQDARSELVRCAGSHFDPRVVRCFLSISIARLRWRSGLVGALAELPLIGVLPRVAAVAAESFSISGPAAGLAGVLLLGLGAFTVPAAVALHHQAQTPAGVPASGSGRGTPPSTNPGTTRTTPSTTAPAPSAGPTLPPTLGATTPLGQTLTTTLVGLLPRGLPAVPPVPATVAPGPVVALPIG